MPQTGTSVSVSVSVRPQVALSVCLLSVSLSVRPCVRLCVRGTGDLSAGVTVRDSGGGVFQREPEAPPSEEERVQDHDAAEEAELHPHRGQRLRHR